MFFHHVEFWLQGYPEHIQIYVQMMLEDGKKELTDFQNEVKLLTHKMEEADKYGADFMFYWSVRDHLIECMRWYKE